MSKSKLHMVFNCFDHDMEYRVKSWSNYTDIVEVNTYLHGYMARRNISAYDMHFLGCQESDIESVYGRAMPIYINQSFRENQMTFYSLWHPNWTNKGELK